MTPRKGPIGVFDSGVGGLTVVAALLRRYPTESVLYVADQAHVPYGGRPLCEVRDFACAIGSFLAAQGCRAVVMACNISSAVALEPARAALAPLPVLGVIAPAAARAAARSRRIGVLATEGTVLSGAYPAQLSAIAPDAVVRQVPCPAFVPLVESGDTDTPEALDAAREYLLPLHAAGCDVVVLGCTHYPYLLPALRSSAASLGWSPVFIDPASEMADALGAAVPGLGAADEGTTELLTTGGPAVLEAQAPRFLPGVRCEVSGAVWKGGALRRTGPSHP